MCTLALALTGLSTGLSAYGQYQQGKAQAAAYEAQAEAAYQNAKIQNKKSELMADQYAQRQRDLDERRRLIVGQQTAAAGASGISSNVGSPLDVYTASMEGWGQDTVNLLTNQRNDTWGSLVNEKNYTNQGNAAMANAKAAKQAGTMGAVITGISGLAAMAGMGASSQKTLAGEASSTPGLANTPTAAPYQAGALDTAMSGVSGYTPVTQGSWQGMFGTYGPTKSAINRYSVAPRGVYFPMR